MGNVRNIISDVMNGRRKPPWRVFLYFVSLLYAGIVRARNAFFDRGLIKESKINCHVVSVGNIAVGGTGKTPMVIMLVQTLVQRGFSPAVLSRGYKGKSRDDVNVVSDGHDILLGPEEAGDEPFLMARVLFPVPVITGKDRYKTGNYAVRNFNSNVLVLDDGFQHRRVARDVDIVLVDHERPLGNGFMLPRGTLREPANALSRASIIIGTGNHRGEENDLFNRLQGLGVFSPATVISAHSEPDGIIDGATGEVSSSADLRGKRIFGFSGIANPERFQRTVSDLGGEIIFFEAFPDHHSYGEKDIMRLMKGREGCGADMLLTTEKDAVKLVKFSEFYRHLKILKISMKIDLLHRETFAEALMEKVL